MNALAALALDFDGVLFDSVPECLRLSYGVFRSMQEGGVGDPSSVVTEEPAAGAREIFLARRGYVRPAAHYYLLWKWVTEFPGRKLSPAEFEALEREDPDRTEAFGRRFFEWRGAIRERHPEQWIDWNRPFPGVVEHWPRLRHVPRYVITTKDRASTEFLLNAHGLDVAGIYAMGQFSTKADPLLRIAAETGGDPTRILFVDDNASHLRDAGTARVVLRWAAWGYDPSGSAVAPALRNFAELADLVASMAGKP